jgi:hypothetical protein
MSRRRERVGLARRGGAAWAEGRGGRHSGPPSSAGWRSSSSPAQPTAFSSASALGTRDKCVLSRRCFRRPVHRLLCHQAHLRGAQSDRDAPAARLRREYRAAKQRRRLGADELATGGSIGGRGVERGSLSESQTDPPSPPPISGKRAPALNVTVEPREIEAASRVAFGGRNREVAARLFLSKKTVWSLSPASTINAACTQARTARPLILFSRTRGRGA